MLHTKDLVVLAPDKDVQFLIRGFLEAAGLAPRTQWETHPLRDTGCFEADEFLQPQVATHEHALIVANHQRSGHAELSRRNMEADIEARLARSGWKGRARAVIIEPGLDHWLMTHELGARAEQGSGAFESADALLRRHRLPRSPELYRQLGKRMATSEENDPAWVKLVSTLKEWFSPNGQPQPVSPEDSLDASEELDLSTLPEVQAHQERAEALRRELEARIDMAPSRCGGKPCIHGHRIWVSTILGLLAGGWSFERVLANYPGLTEADLRACLAFGSRAVEQLYPGFSQGNEP